MEKITKVTQEDNGRVAVSEDGYFRVRILEGRGDESTVEFLKETGSWKVGRISEGFGLVTGARDMFWEEVQPDFGQGIGFWFESKKAADEYGINAVKAVLSAAFDAAPTPSRAWDTIDVYFRNWESTFEDPEDVNGIDGRGHFDGWCKDAIADVTKDVILSFEDFAAKVGVNIYKSTEQAVPDCSVPYMAPKKARSGTPFTDWCIEKGYDPEGEFVFDLDKTNPASLSAMFCIKDVLKLHKDDGSLCPEFADAEGVLGFEEFNSPGSVVLKPKGVAKPRYRKPRQKPSVRQKTDLTLVYKTGQRYTVKNVEGICMDAKVLSIGTTRNIDKGILVGNHTLIEKDLIKSFVVSTPEGKYAIVNYDKDWLINSPKGFAIASQWSQHF